MQKWKCHKVVEAARIMRIDISIAGVGASLILQLDEQPGQIIQPVTREWLKKHEPDVGGYYVQYEDGYASYSPAAAFEAGYTPVGDGDAV